MRTTRYQRYPPSVLDGPTDAAISTITLLGMSVIYTISGVFIAVIGVLLAMATLFVMVLGVMYLIWNSLRFLWWHVCKLFYR